MLAEIQRSIKQWKEFRGLKSKKKQHTEGSIETVVLDSIRELTMNLTHAIDICKQTKEKTLNTENKLEVASLKVKSLTESIDVLKKQVDTQNSTLKDVTTEATQLKSAVEDGWIPGLPNDCLTRLETLMRAKHITKNPNEKEGDVTTIWCFVRVPLGANK
eukprot:UN34595